MHLIIDLGHSDIKGVLLDNEGNIMEDTRFLVPTLFKAGGKALTGHKNKGIPCEGGLLGVGEFLEPLDPTNVNLITKSICMEIFYEQINDIDSITYLVPVGRYDELYDTLLSKVKLNEVDLFIEPQTICMDFDGLIVDIGGGTTDFILIEDDTIRDYHSLDKGSRKIINDIIIRINDEYSHNPNTEAIKDLLKEGKMQIKVKGKYTYSSKGIFKYLAAFSISDNDGSCSKGSISR